MSTIVINIFSGRPNPEWPLDHGLADEIRRRINELPPLPRDHFRALGPLGEPADPVGRPRSGFRGIELFETTPLQQNPEFVFFGGLVFEPITGLLRSDAHLDFAQKLFRTIPVEIHTDLDGMNLQEVMAADEEVPIAGVDGPFVRLPCDHATRYLGSSDPFNLNKYPKNYRSVNNCYNYAMDALTTTGPRAISGRSNRLRKPSVEALRDALALDLLDYKGTQQPSECAPEDAHWVAALVRHHPKRRVRDFHFLRLDQTGQWSHKDGNGPVENDDEMGDPLLDLSKAILGWSPQLAGFFIAHERHKNMVD